MKVNVAATLGSNGYVLHYYNRNQITDISDVNRKKSSKFYKCTGKLLSFKQLLCHQITNNKSSAFTNTYANTATTTTTTTTTYKKNKV